MREKRKKGISGGTLLLFTRPVDDRSTERNSPFKLITLVAFARCRRTQNMTMDSVFPADTDMTAETLSVNL
ncbi:MAG: hypothetical protein OXC79_01335 [Candidatus Poribacteria bacterium]|nr:hypothetical protein [Candidatus Poribacteria bacterium]